MNTLHKLLKISGAVCLSCICLVSRADPKIVTLEELRNILDKECSKTQEDLKSVREEIRTGNQKGFTPTYNNSYSYDIPSTLSEKFKGITHVEYNAEGEPTVIETVNGWRPEVPDILQFIPREDAPFRQHIREKFSNTTSAACLDKISKELTAKELEARGVTDDDMKEYEIASVREITFDSILESNFFDDIRRAKGRLCFENRKELEKCIDAYVNEAMFLRFITYRRKDTRIDLVTETSSNNSTFKIREEAQQPNEEAPDFVYEVSGERRQKMQKILADGLKDLLRYKNGKEKVILLLLLDEMTLPEFRLKWVHQDDQYGGYYSYRNWIMSDFETNGFKCLSHEVGHYLQSHLGLRRDWKTNDEFREAFEDYQMKFAKELLLTEPTKPKTAQKINIPGNISSHIEPFYDNPHWDSNIRFNQLPEKDLFVHWQLVSRWSNAWEAPNILGIYFNHSKKTVYVCALSDIRELKRIRYGHAPRPSGEYIGRILKHSNNKTYLKALFTEAAEQKPSADTLKLLCRLHNRPNDESKVFNMFDYEDEAFLIHDLSYLCDFITAGE